MYLVSDGNRYVDKQEICKTFTVVTSPLGSTAKSVQVRVLLPTPEKTTCFDTSFFQLNSPYGELNLLRKRNWLTPAKLPSAAKGEFNFALCNSTEFRCFARNNFATANGGNFANNILVDRAGSSPKARQL